MEIVMLAGAAALLLLAALQHEPKRRPLLKGTRLHITWRKP